MGKKKSIKQVYCPYCGEKAQLIEDKEIYGRSYKGYMWACLDCDAWVGVHKNSKRYAPLGRLANAELRYWKKKAHACFDPLWKRKMVRDGCSKNHARNKGYEWLAKQLGISKKKCHIGHFDVDTCKKVVSICSAYRIPKSMYKSHDTKGVRTAA